MRAGAGTRPPFTPARSSEPFPMPIDDEKSGRPKRTTPAKGGYSQLTIRLTFPYFAVEGVRAITQWRSVGSTLAGRMRAGEAGSSSPRHAVTILDLCPF